MIISNKLSFASKGEKINAWFVKCSTTTITIITLWPHANRSPHAHQQPNALAANLHSTRTHIHSTIVSHSPTSTRRTPTPMHSVALIRDASRVKTFIFTTNPHPVTLLDEEQRLRNPPCPARGESRPNKAPQPWQVQFQQGMSPISRSRHCSWKMEKWNLDATGNRC